MQQAEQPSKAKTRRIVHSVRRGRVSADDQFSPDARRTETARSGQHQARKLNWRTRQSFGQAGGPQAEKFEAATRIGWQKPNLVVERRVQSVVEGGVVITECGWRVCIDL